MMTLHRVPKPSTSAPSSSSSSSSSSTAAAIILQLASEKAEYWGDEAREWRGFLVCAACRGCGTFQTQPLPLPPPSPPLSTLSLTLCLSVCPSICLSVCLSVLVVRRTWRLASLGCLPPLRVQYVQSTLCQLFIFFPSRLVLSQSSLHVVFFFHFFLSFFFFFFNLRLTFTVWQCLLSQNLQMGVQAGWRAVTQPLSGAFWGPRCCLLYMIAAL